MTVKSYYDNMVNRKAWHIPLSEDPIESIAHHIVDSRSFFFNKDNAYIKLKTHFEKIEEDDLEALVRNMIEPDDCLCVDSRHIKEAIKRVRGLFSVQIDLDTARKNNKYLINVKNGIYNIMSMQLTPHEEDRVFNYCLNFKYLPEAERKLDTFNYFVETSIGEDNRECLLRTIGAALSSIRDIKKTVILLGNGDSGKSKLLQLLKMAVGEQYTTEKKFHLIGSEKSIASYTEEKRVNISDDITIGTIKEDDGFKTAVSCDTITGRLLYRNEVSITPHVFFIAAGNAFPKFRHYDDAVLNRLVIIKVKGYNETPDPDFADKLMAEKDSICSAAVDCLKEFIKEKYDFHMSRASNSILEHERNSLHTSETFIQDNYTVGEGGDVSKVKLYAEYKEWCSLNAYEAVGRNTFYEKVKLSFPKITEGKVHSETGYINGFKGLKPKESEENFIVERKF